MNNAIENNKTSKKSANTKNIKKHNVLYVHYGDDWIRGSEKCLLELVAGLDKRCYEAIVWCNSAILAAELKKLGGGITVIEEKKFNWLFTGNGKGAVGCYLKQLFKAAGLIRQYKVDMVHCNSGAPCQWMIPAAKITGVPVLGHLHARYFASDRYAMLLHMADKLVGVSKPVIQGLVDDGVNFNKTCVIPNGINVANFENQPIVNIKAHFNIDHRYLFAQVGSLIPRKGFDLSIEMIALLRNCGYEAGLLVIGSGPQEAALKQLAQKLGVADSIHFLGEQHNVSGLLKGGVDVFVSSAREEVFGLCIAEAASVGLPVVATRVGGVPEVMEDQQSAILCLPDSAEALMQASKILLDNPALAARLAENARARVHQRFTTQVYVARFETIYREMLAGEPEKSNESKYLEVYKNLLRRVADHFLKPAV